MSATRCFDDRAYPNSGLAWPILALLSLWWLAGSVWRSRLGEGRTLGQQPRRSYPVLTRELEFDGAWAVVPCIVY
ncbi:hypothetical protein BKA63DRAFT_507226, partial [Paraphoma chrysanthemicola]